jgi:hypothetical protein
MGSLLQQLLLLLLLLLIKLTYALINPEVQTCSALEENMCTVLGEVKGQTCCGKLSLQS